MGDYFISLNLDIVDYRKNPPKSEKIPQKIKNLAWVRDIANHDYFPQDGDTFYYNDGLGKGISKCGIAPFTWRNTDMPTLHEKGLVKKENHVLFFPANSTNQWAAQAAEGYNNHDGDPKCECLIANYAFSNFKQTTSSGKKKDLLTYPTYFTLATMNSSLWYKNANLKLPKDTKGKRPAHVECETTFMLKYHDKDKDKVIWICWDPRIVVELDDSP